MADIPVKEFESEQHEARFTIPERPTVRQQLRYKGILGSFPGADYYLNTWEAAKLLIIDWECPNLELNADLDQITDPKATYIIQWVGILVWNYITSLEEVPKN